MRTSRNAVVTLFLLQAVVALSFSAGCSGAASSTSTSSSAPSLVTGQWPPGVRALIAQHGDTFSVFNSLGPLLTETIGETSATEGQGTQSLWPSFAVSANRHFLAFRMEGGDLKVWPIGRGQEPATYTAGPGIVDGKKLSGVHAIQTLSRLNRIHPEKADTMVLDFVNDAEDIAVSFQPYYENTMLSEGTDPNLLYDLETRLKEYGLFGTADIDVFAAAFFAGKNQAKLYSILKPAVDRWIDLKDHEKKESRKTLADYVNTYTFLGQLLTFTDADLEKLFVYAKYLRRYLPYEPDRLPLDVQEKADIESYRVSESFRGDIQLDRGKGEVEPTKKPGPGQTPETNLEPLSAIIAELNERFGADLTEEDKVTIGHLEDLLGADETLKASIKVNPPETARLAFDHIVQDRLQEIVETNFKLYKRVVDDQGFGRVLVDWLYDRFRKEVK